MDETLPPPYNVEEALQHLTANDPDLARLIDRIGPFTLQVRAGFDPFQALLRSVVYQQLSGKAAATIFGRVKDLFPDQTPTPQHLSLLSDDVLRGAGMSRAKVASAKDLAAKTIDGTIPDRQRLLSLDDEVIVERLIQVRGVGRWTVEMLLMFYLGRPNILPATDLGVRKGFMRTYGLENMPTPKHILAHGNTCWNPFRSVASWYMWRAADEPEDARPAS